MTFSQEIAYLSVCSEPGHACNVHSKGSKMSSVVDPLLSTVTLDLLRPKEILGNPEDHFRKVRLGLMLPVAVNRTYLA